MSNSRDTNLDALDGHFDKVRLFGDATKTYTSSHDYFSASAWVTAKFWLGDFNISKYILPSLEWQKIICDQILIRQKPRVL
jgi:hypothetical protein